MTFDQLNQLSFPELFSYYKRHKDRKCNGYFDAKVRGSTNRYIVNLFEQKFGIRKHKIYNDPEFNLM